MDLVNETPLETAWITGKTDPLHWSMTCMVKGTFRLRHDGTAVLAEEQLELTGDAYVDGDPSGVLRYADDFAYKKPRTDLLLTGTCFAPGGTPVRSAFATFRVGSHEKTLAVVGDRYWAPLAGATEPELFAEMPITYERAYGGLGFPRNPLGKGFVEIADGERARLHRLPNVENPRQLITDPTIPIEPVGFGPLPQSWPQRMSKTGTFDDEWLKARWPWYPVDFDYGFFNAAPEDQQVPYLLGNEEIFFENLNREHARFRSRLPGIRPRCFVRELLRGSFVMREVPLALDTLWVNMDAEQLVLVWRGVTPVRSDKLLEFSHLLVAAELVSEVAQPADVYANVLSAALIRREEEDAEDFDLEEPEEEEEEKEEEEEEELAAGEPPVLPTASATSVAAPPAAAPTGAELTQELLDNLQQSSERLQKMGKNVPDALAAALASPPVIPDEPVEEAEIEEPEIEPGEIPGAEFEMLTREQIVAKIANKQSLAEHDLTGMDLAGLDLSGIDLHESILQDTLLSRSILNGANFTGAYLAHADLRQARAKAAIFADADLTSALLGEADFSDADLRGADFSQADLRQANLARVQADGAILPEADLSYANLQQACFAGADLAGCRFHHANLSDADLTGAVLEQAWGRGVSAQRAIFVKTAAADAAFSEGNFESLRGDESVWENAQLYGCRFAEARLNAAEFSGAYLVRANFNGAELREAVFDEASLRDASVVRTNLLAASMVKAELTNADLRESNFYGANLRETSLATANHEGANLRMTVQTTEAE